MSDDYPAFVMQLDYRLGRELKAAAERQGVSVEALAKRWLQEKLDDDMRRRLLEAARVNTPDPQLLHEETCAVTMYDMKLRLMSDGRERGLWVFLKDESPDRERNLGKVNEAALLEWPQAQKLYAAMGKELRGKKDRA